MLVRQPVVAGRFYQGNPEKLTNEIDKYLSAHSASENAVRNAWAVMLPHAGHIYCGDVIGSTLAGVRLPSRLVILCPNHTGYGRMLSVWPQGAWLTPLGPVKVDAALAADIIASGGGFEADTQAHAGEHSIEVILPFLQYQTGNLSIVPICVGTQNNSALAGAGHALASVLRMPQYADTGLVISSDMNHYENERATFAKDDMALDRIMALDPAGLLEVVRDNKISMCGAGPMALALYAALDMGYLDIELAAHETSGKTSGDHEHTVGYAGLECFLQKKPAQAS